MSTHDASAPSRHRPVESAADYPRPPRVEPSDRHLQIYFAGRLIADTRRAQRLLETTHAPCYYIPPEDVDTEVLAVNSHRTICEYKGEAHYYDVEVGGKRASQAVWCYPKPKRGFEALAGHYAFYVHAMERCLVDGESARPEPIRYYGGWVTSDVVGPFAGER